MNKIFTLIITLAVAPWLANAQTSYGWYNYGYTLEANGYTPDYYLTHVFPDSTVFVEYSSGLGTVWMHGLGQVFDPTSLYYDIEYTQSLEEGDAFMVDSIGFPYRYFRSQNDAPDTLVIQFFTQADFDSLYSQPWPTSPGYEDRSYARLAYDTLVRRHSDPTLEIVELLDNDDIATTVEYKSFAIGHAIPPGQICAATVTYLPGNPYNAGDTLDAEYFPVPTNQINDFIMNYYLDNDLVYDQDLYNHGIIATASGRYNDNSNGWGGQYWPGMASGGGIYHAAIDFLISSHVGVEDESPLTELVLVPNPTNGLSDLRLTAQVAGEFTLSITDITGKETVESTKVNLKAGPNQVTVDVEELPAGIYFVQLANVESIRTVKLLKQ